MARRGLVYLPFIKARVSEGDVTCVPQVTGKIQLQRGHYICSPSGEYLFGMSHEGDLSLLQNDEKKWSVSILFASVLYVCMYIAIHPCCRTFQEAKFPRVHSDDFMHVPTFTLSRLEPEEPTHSCR